MVQFPRHVSRNRAAAIAVIVFGVSFVAKAQDPAPPADAPKTDPATPAPAVTAPPPPPTAPTPTAAPAAPAVVSSAVKTVEKPAPFFHGSALSYGHSVSIGTVAPIDTQYQPSW